MKWFRFYSEVLHDPKVQRLNPQSFKHWVNLLCLAASNDGMIDPDRSNIAFALRVSESMADAVVAGMINEGLLDETETGLQPHNWNARQFASDVSTNRVKKFREQKRSVKETFRERPQIQIQIQNREEPPLPPKGEEKPDPIEEALKATAETLTNRHPAVRSCGVKECQTLLKKIIAKDKGTATKLEHLQRIDETHKRMCGTHEWQKHGGEYSKALNNWLAPTMGRYEAAPLLISRDEEEIPF